jgi:hypothetical protein
MRRPWFIEPVEEKLAPDAPAIAPPALRRAGCFEVEPDVPAFVDTDKAGTEIRRRSNSAVEELVTRR